MTVYLRSILACLFIFVLGCEADPRDPGDPYWADNDSDSDSSTDSAGNQCETITRQVEPSDPDPIRPIDFIFIVDNSGSMADEIQAIEDNINVNFAEFLDASGLDYRVILLSSFGGSAAAYTSLCIEEPLGAAPAGSCSSWDTTDLPMSNPPKFYHLDHGAIGSNDALCKLLSSMNNPDIGGVALGGIAELLRPGSLKIFVAFTDDAANCSSMGYSFKSSGSFDPSTGWLDFDAALKEAAPEHFDTGDPQGDYVWHSVIGMSSAGLSPWYPIDPVSNSTCQGGVHPGPYYQSLSMATGGLRFSVCEPNDYDQIFQTLSLGERSTGQLSCTFPLPQPPDTTPFGEIKLMDMNLTIELTDGTVITLDQQRTSALCDADSYYITMEEAVLCPEACSIARMDEGAILDASFLCGELPSKNTLPI